MHWVNVFSKAWKKDLSEMGYSIDWRRNFVTTDINPTYDAFIRWQFRTLRKKGYVDKGKHPVVWCKKCNNPVGDHSRVSGEGETPMDFIWGKYRMENSDLILMAGTTRPDAFYGQTNLWIDPKGDYAVVQVGDEKWVVGRKAVDKIENQYKKAKILRSIKPKELIGKWVHCPLLNKKIYTVVADFIDADIGSGIVFSALEDPVDLYELKKIQSNPELIKKYNLDLKVVMALKPIDIIKVPGMGSNLGEHIGKEFGITSAKQVEELEKAKGELNRRVFRKGVMLDNCGVCAGMTVPDAQVLLKKKLVKENDAVMFYELTGPVVCRCLTPSVIKIVEDQWFVLYGDKKWKKTAHKCLDNMKLYPDRARSQFNYVLDWLNDWACTREYGMGTKLPWEEKWKIESLSDSTIYMAYYTIAHKIKDIPIDKLNDNFFDYVLLGKGDAKKLNVDKKLADELKTEFNYWYPMDYRSTGKDLIQNHMSFCIFVHTAIFPEKHWPVAYGLNGWMTVDGQKMSKSLGNTIPIREMNTKFGADASRFAVLSGGEGMDDANWETDLAKTMSDKLPQLIAFAKKWYNKGTEKERTIDKWMLSQLNQVIKDTTELMENNLFRSALQKSYFELQRSVKWYMRRTIDNPNKKVMKKIIETQALLLAPITPFTCEEIWELIGKKGFISTAEWPKASKVVKDRSEDIIRDTMEDIHSVLNLLKIKKPKKIALFVADKWKYDLYKILKKKLEKTRDFKEIMSEVMKNSEMKRYAKDITKIIQKVVKSGIDDCSTQSEECDVLKQSIDFFKNDFKAEISVEKAENSKENKARKALPGKVAILVE